MTKPGVAGCIAVYLSRHLQTSGDACKQKEGSGAGSEKCDSGDGAGVGIINVRSDVVMAKKSI
jgi:hypothetical protein